MMKRNFVFTVILMFSVLCTATESDFIIENYRFFIVHPRPDSAINKITTMTSETGGHLISMVGYRLKVSIPVDKKVTFIKGLRAMGYVNDEMAAVSDVSQQVLDLRTKIKVKRDYLSKLYSVFDESSYTETIEMEKELDSVIHEIENLEGELRRYQKNSDNAIFDITVSQESVSVNSGDYRTSQFKWINRLGISNIMEN